MSVIVADSAVADSNYNLKWPQLQQFFEQQGKIEDKNIEFKCVLCKPKHKTLSTSSTSYSNLRAHIKSTHKSMLDKFNDMVKKRSLNQDKPSTLKQLNLHEFKKQKTKLSQATFDRANMELIISTVSPFSFIEHPAFLKYTNTVAQMVPVSRRTLMRNINSSFEEMKNSIIKKFNDLEYVCVTADCWTAFRRSYMGFTAHWIDPFTFERKSNAIACRRIIGKHTYDVLADMIELVLNEYKINTKVTYMVTDNASNFAKAFRLYSTTEDEIETPENDSLIYSTDIFEILSEGEERHFRLPKQLRCASHTFNLLATNDVNKLQIKDGPYKTLSRRAFGKCNALFNKQNNEYSNSSPKLPLNTFSEEIQKLYIKYNTSIPSSAHVERLFSAGGQLFDERRGSMSDDTFEMSLLKLTSIGDL
ncbi:uncharacterized protein LOC132953601 [Metopolophium dirhodum]|uniref:uncharacterized protein LOC132953601 n=1 Tax=Metopolophium dirhodum TaxID=44670 RepID=UPI00298FCA52|nr:uncharacterized protein LOC132953601 [Metopolophium dirhodum]